MSHYSFLHGVTKFIFSFRPRRYTGRENIPSGSAVICANHAHASDPFHVLHGFSGQERVWIMAKEELSHVPVVGGVLRWLGSVIWVKRGKADVGAIKSALKALKGGEKLLIFPEGTRREEIGEGKNGAAMLAIRTGVPILPVYVSAERKWFQPVRIVIGKPYLPFTEERKATVEDYDAATEELMKRIKALRDAEVVSCRK